jgi:hypothetical protein
MVERMALVSHLRGVDEVVVHDEEATSAGHDLSFSVAGDVPVLGAGATWILRPRRATTSAVLREALLPVVQENVA